MSKTARIFFVLPFFSYLCAAKFIISVKIKEVISALERFAPLPLQESWDNAGMQIGLTEAEDVSGALLCLDVTEEIIDEAIRLDCNLIVSHHPLLFRGLKHITPTDSVSRCVIKAIRNNICITSMHTNMDNAMNGVNHKIAEKLGLSDIRFISPRTVGGIECGSGVIGTLAQPLSANKFIAAVKTAFNARVAMTNELLHRHISTVAVCGGAGDFLIDEAIRNGADAFITGEMHYHQYFAHEQELQICVIGHYESEQYTNEIFRDIINRECPGVKTYITEKITNPIKYY